MPQDDSLELFPESASKASPTAVLTDPHAPLAERMRPRSLAEVCGQDHLLGPGAGLRALIDAGELPSLVFWGPPGCGKTTLARLLAHHAELRFEALSAVTAGLKEIRGAAESARRARAHGQRTLLFLDEIHRLNRVQQDALLPHVESGTLTLLGATTENPSFEVIAPLLSRCRVLTLERLGEEDLGSLLRRAAGDVERGLGAFEIPLADDAVAAIAAAADGDARRALGILETATHVHREHGGEQTALSLESIREVVGRRVLLHDKDREEHYNVVSALIKSLRASDPDAALYYAARMLEAGEDPLFILRRLVVFASEDIGNAEPGALSLALAAYQTVERIGLPEGRIAIGQAVSFLACAPKSNAAYRGIDRALADARERGSLPVPLHLRNAPTGLMKRLGYGRDYEYPHDAEDAFVSRRNLPEALGNANYYEPRDVGAEAEVAQRLEQWRARRSRLGRDEDPE